MKKLLLQIFLICLTTYYANAQCSVGKFTNAIYDDFSSATEPTGPDLGGLYFWPGTVATGVVRNAALGVLELNVTQVQGGYDPFGIGFGDVNNNGTGAPYTINLSSNATFSVTVKNKSTTETIRFRMSIQDIQGDVIDTDSIAGDDGGGSANAWKYVMDVVIAPGATQTLTQGTANSSGDPLGISSGTYKGGYYTNYANWPPVLDQNVDFTQIQGITFTVVNNANTGDPLYQPLAITNLPIEITAVRVGGCVLGLVNSLDSKNMSIAPNPATSIATVSYKATSNVVVNVSDVMGNLVKTINGDVASANIDVAGLAKGIYFVTVVADGTPVSAQKLLVE